MIKRVFIALVILSFPFLIVSRVSADSRTTLNYQSPVVKDGITIIPYLTWDKRTLFIDFESKNFSKIENVSYTVSYDSEQGSRGFVSGFNPPTQKNQYLYYKGIPYVRRQFTLGSCSGSVCVYDNHPSNFKIVVKTQYKGFPIKIITQTVSVAH